MKIKLPAKLKGDKKPSPGIYILLAAGAAMLILGSLPQKQEPESLPKSENTDSYICSLEKELCDILSSIEGAGEVKVMLVAQNSGSVDVGRDGKGENEKTVVLSRQGGGEALVLAENTPDVRGAVIVAAGAGSDRVRADLTQAAATALGIGAHRVKVYKGA